MSYRQKYELKHMREIRRARRIKILIRWMIFLLFIGSMLGTMIGISALDGNTEKALAVLMTSLIVLCGSGYTIDRLEESEWDA